MLHDEVRKLAALDSTYPRAVELVRSNRVTKLEVMDGSGDGLVELKSSVKGSNRSYRVEVHLDEANGLIYDHSCTCPAHKTYDGLCKHTAAVVLAYLESIGDTSLKVIPFPGASTSKTSTRTSFNYLPTQTSPAIEKFMTRSAKQVQESVRTAIDARQAQEADPADLTCIIKKSYDRADEKMWSLGLQIVQGKTSCAVNGISDLVEAWRKERVASYGKIPSFVHRKSAFTERANTLLEMLAPLVDAQQSLRIAQESNSYAYGYSYGYAKNLPLTSAQVGEILELMTDATVLYEEGYDYPYRTNHSRRKDALEVVDGDPKLDITIVKDRNGDYELHIHPSDIECIEGSKRLYLLTRNQVLRCSEEFSAKMASFCNEVLPCRSPLCIRKQDMPGFCATALDLLRDFTALKAPADLDATLPFKPKFVFYVGLQDDYLTCTAKVQYGEASINLFDSPAEGQPARDVAQEIAAQQVVRTYFPSGNYKLPDYSRSARSSYSGQRTGDWYRYSYSNRTPNVPCFLKHDHEAYYVLFSEGLRELAQLGEVRLSDHLANVRIRQSPSISVKAEVRGGLLDISLETLDMTPQELVSYLSSYRRKQRYVRLGNGDIMRLDGNMQAFGDLAEGLGVSEADLVSGLRGVHASRTLFVNEMLKKDSEVQFKRNANFRRIVRNFETAFDADYAVPESLSHVLRPYQTEGFKWLSTLGETSFGGILADDMGLGKTLQTIAYLLARHERGEKKPALVVCPASLVYNWISEIERFAPSLDAHAVTGAKGEREALIAEAKMHHVLVTSYDLMKRDAESYSEQHFSCMILDEAQYIKNSTTKAARCAKSIMADVRFALTGTPIENRLLELWSIFDFLMPGALGTKDSFSKRFSRPIANGDDDAARRLQSLVGPFILRRLKSQVLTDLPDKNESVVYASMSGEQEKLYRSSEAKLALTLKKQLPEEFAHAKLEVLAELTKLRQLCCDPNLLYENYKGGSAKLDTCIELVRSAIAGDHRVLLFSQFTSMLEIIEGRLNTEKVNYLKLTGATSKEERVRLVNRFQEGEIPVFLISLKAGGVGLNLTAADIVIHYDPWWNLAAQNQATDRAHRIGQEKEVSVFKLIAKNTIEERIVQMQERKRDLAESVLGGEAAGSTSITREDVLVLLNANG